MGRGLTGPRRGGKAAAAGLGAGARGEAGLGPAGLHELILGEREGCAPRPRASALPPRRTPAPAPGASRLGPAGFSPPVGAGGCQASGCRDEGSGRMPCPGRSPTAPTPLAPSLPWKGEAGEVPPVGLWPAGAGGKGSWAGRAKESLAFPGLACCLRAGGGCRAPPPSLCASCHAPCRLPCTPPASAEAGGAVRSRQLGAEAQRVHSLLPSAWLPGTSAGAWPGVAKTGSFAGSKLAQLGSKRCWVCAGRGLRHRWGPPFLGDLWLHPRGWMAGAQDMQGMVAVPKTQVEPRHSHTAGCHQPHHADASSTRVPAGHAQAPIPTRCSELRGPPRRAVRMHSSRMHGPSPSRGSRGASRPLRHFRRQWQECSGRGNNAGTLQRVPSVTRPGAAARARPRAQGAGRKQMEMTLVAVSCGRMRPAFSTAAPDAEPEGLQGPGTPGPHCAPRPSTWGALLGTVCHRGTRAQLCPLLPGGFLPPPALSHPWDAAAPQPLLREGRQARPEPRAHETTACTTEVLFGTDGFPINYVI